MEILLAKDMGFCWGVRRAVDIMERAAQEQGEIISVGPIVHNPQVVEELAEKGIRVNSKLEETDGQPVAITAHGVGPDVLDAVRQRGSEVIDTTCPIVTRSQRWARKMAESGFTVLVFGDPEHREVRGVLGWAGDKGLAIADGQPLPADLPSRLAIISQTTQSPERFAAFVSRILQQRVAEISELRVINTLCDVTSSQQGAARELAHEVDLMLVIGGKNSANTRHLLEVCREEEATAHHIETAAELDPAWFRGIQRVGVTAGTSTPDSAVEAVVQRVREIAAALESAAGRGAH
ncbi:MAG TPA: 4-hydroxy-3-methylbut-2-enyl diphosphate reductase [Dehalococcoidia bacterium]|nr:4-hydroxy-3-methylbut-2-enyl diphosphate reductase [Dehalococcoidia bacterium]